MTEAAQDSTRVVVSGERHGGVLPGNRAEMWRDVYLLSGADVRGGVWGNQIVVKGSNVRVSDAVYARGTIRVQRNERENGSGRVCFGSCVASPDSLLVEGLTSHTRICSDVYCGRLKLTNTVVYGNVYARSAVLSNCVVLGGVFCKEALRVERSVMSTFQAGSAQLGEHVKLLFPVAASEEPFVLGGPVTVLTFWQLTGRKELNKPDGAVLLDESDIYEMKVPEESGDPRVVHVLSTDQRILDTNEAVRRFLANRRTLEFMGLRENRQQCVGRGKEDEYLDQVEAMLLKVAALEEMRELGGSSPVEELLSRADVLSAVREFASFDPRDAFSEAGGIESQPTADRSRVCFDVPKELATLFSNRSEG